MNFNEFIEKLKKTLKLDKIEPDVEFELKSIFPDSENQKSTTQPTTQPTIQPQNPTNLPNLNNIQSAGSDASLLEGLRAELQSFAKALADEKIERQKIQQTLDDKIKSEMALRIKSAIDEGIKSNKIPAKNEEDIKRWQGLFEKDFDAANFALSKIKGDENKNSLSQEKSSSRSTPQFIDRTAVFEQAKDAFKNAEN